MQTNSNLTTELILKAKNGDTNALKSILKTAEKNIYAYLYYLTDNETEKDDMAQEILVKVAKNIGKLKNPETFKSWLNKIIVRQYYDFIRKNKKHQKIHSEDISDIKEASDIKDDKNAPVENCINCELNNVIKASVCKLTEPYKLAILMREFQGLSYDEIAKLTNTNVGTVKSRIARARNRLKEYIKPYME